MGVELRRFSRGGGVEGVSRVTWHLPSPGPGEGCPRQGRPHLLHVCLLRCSSSTGATEVEEGEGEEGVEEARAAWWQAALLLSLALLLGPRFGRRRPAGWGGGRVGWRGASGRPRELEVVKVSLPPWAERERVASPPAAQQPRNSAKALFTRVSLVGTFPAVIFI